MKRLAVLCAVLLCLACIARGQELSPTNDADYQAAQVLANKAAKISREPERTDNLDALMLQTEPLAKKYPDALQVWMWRADAALQLYMPKEGYQAAMNIRRLADVGKGSVAAASVVANLAKNGWLVDPGSPREEKPLSVNLGGGVSIDLVWIPAGHYVMGRGGDHIDEKPAHRVIISNGFWMGKTEVTQAQWSRLITGNASFFKGDKLPVEQIGWVYAEVFCSNLTTRLRGQRLHARLPTEAEWEYACRAGTKDLYNRPLDEAGWYKANSDEHTHEVALKKPNDWGLYDMHGNVWEWCADWYNVHYYDTSPAVDPQGPDKGYDRAMRGGSWHSEASDCQSADRLSGNPDDCRNTTGFRVVVSR